MLCSLTRALRAKTITNAENRDQMARVRRIAFDFLPKVRDVFVQRAVENRRIVRDQIEHLAARQGVIRI